MVTNIDLYDRTIEKLNGIISAIEEAIRISDPTIAFEQINRLRNYKDCFYCVQYRKSLDDKGFAGCCDGCPCHSLGEMILGRKRLYNGCYVIGPYRDMVRYANLLNDEPNEDNAKLLIEAIRGVIMTMENHKNILG